MVQNYRYFIYDNRRRSFTEIHDGTICGRTEGTLRFPTDTLVSKSHCRFSIIGSEIYIEDFGSTNRTYINTVAISQRKRRRIRLNDVIEFGTQRLILTNQDRHPPQNTQDQKTTKLYKGFMKDDGSITASITGFTGYTGKRTHLKLSRSVFQALRMKKALRPLSDHWKSALFGFLMAISTAGVLAGGYYCVRNFGRLGGLSQKLSVISCEKNPGLPYCNTISPERRPGQVR